MPISAAGVAWSSLNVSVATVTDGLVTGVSAGATRIIASAGAKADSIDVVVVTGLSLEIVPGGASVLVGRTALFTVVAKNGAGEVVAVPPAIWRSGNPSVGTVANGLATGVSVGSTPITATVGSTTSPPATLLVSAPSLDCDGIADVPRWEVSLSFDYGARATNGDNEQLDISHSGRLTAVLAPAGGVVPASQWEGSLVGNVSMIDRRTDLKSNPVTTDKFDGTGPAVSDLGRSTFILNVDVDQCTYTLSANPFVHATLTTVSMVETVDIALAVIHAASPLGAWKGLGLPELGASFDAHHVTAAGRVDKDTYYPFGFGQLLWINNGSLDAPQGAATVSYTILAK